MSDYYAPSRFAPKPTGARVAPIRPAGRPLAESLRDTVAVLRVHVVWDRANRPRWIVEGWTEHYVPVPLDADAQAQLFAWLRDTWPAVHWWRPVQYDLRTGVLGTAPELLDDGYLPEDDLTFGVHRPPVLADHTTPPLPFAAPETARRAA